MACFNCVLNDAYISIYRHSDTCIYTIPVSIYYYSDEFNSDEFNSDEFMYAYPIVVLRIDLIKQVYFYKYNNKYNNFFISINIIIFISINII